MLKRKPSVLVVGARADEEPPGLPVEFGRRMAELLDEKEPDMSERTASVPVTQFMRPNGRQVPNSMSTTPELAELAKKVIAAGYRFEAEVLMTGEVSLDCCNLDKQLAWQICNNGPEVHNAVDTVIRDAATALGLDV